MSENKESYSVPVGYFYTKDHEWLKRKSDGTCLIGITDFAAKMLHDIVYVTLPSPSQSFSMSEVFGQVESVKTVSDIYMPISGTVNKSNEKLTKEPEIVSSSPYADGWMLEVNPTNYETEMSKLMSPEEYSKYIQGLAQQ